MISKGKLIVTVFSPFSLSDALCRDGSLPGENNTCHGSFIWKEDWIFNQASAGYATGMKLIGNRQVLLGKTLENFWRERCRLAINTILERAVFLPYPVSTRLPGNRELTKGNVPCKHDERSIPRVLKEIMTE